MITRKTLLLGMGLCILWPSGVWADVETLRPNAPGDICGFPWGCVSCPDHYQCVDEAVSDGDATEVHSTCTYGYCGELYNMEDFYGPYGIISRITVYARFKSNVDPSRTSAYIQISTGGTVYSGSEVTVTTSWADYSYEWTTNPKTGTTWNWTDINALQIGTQMRRPHASGVGIYTYCTQLYVVVEYSGSCEPAAITSGATGGGTVTEGDPGPFVFTVTTSGDPAPTYQWKRAGLDGGDVYDEAGHISGATTDTLTITNVEVTDEGDYTCVASNICGYEESAPATFIVNWAPTIETLRPNAPGDVCSVTFQTGAACPDHYLNVDDATSDEDATKVYATSTPGYTTDLYNIDDPGVSSGVITKLVVYARFKRSLKDKYGNDYTPRSSAIVQMKTGGTVYQGGSYLVPTDWTDYSQQWTINPKTGVAWTWPDMVNLQIGIQLRRAASSGIGIYTYCTQTYARVYYESATGACCHPSGSCLDETETHCIDDYNGYWLGDGTSCVGLADCNTNSIPDECEIAAGISPDCNGNNVPDECDIAESTSPDCNGNNVPDECDIAESTSPDCNSNGVPDECDITSTGLDYNTIIDLGTLDGVYGSAATDINNAGQVTGWSYNWEGYWRGFLWEDGVMTNLGTLPDYIDESEAFSINDDGQVVGYSISYSTGYLHAFLWDNDVMTDLGTLGGRMSEAFGINNAGQVVGWSERADHGAWHAFLITPQGGVWYRDVDTDGVNDFMTDLGLLPGADESLARDINDAGQVVGLLYYAAYWHAFLLTPEGGVWYRDVDTDGANDLMTDLGTLPGDENSRALRINSAGQIVGYSHDDAGSPFGYYHAFLWENDVMTGLGTLPGDIESGATDINDAGQVVGWSKNSANERRTFLDSGGVMYNLEDLTPASSAWNLYYSSYSTSINDAGWIVGRGVNPDGEKNGYLTKPDGPYSEDANGNGIPDECEEPDQLHLTGPIPNEIDVGGTGTIDATVQADFMGLSGWEVVFTKFAGDFTFMAGAVSPDGTQATVVSDADGAAQMTFVADAVGSGLIGVSVTDTALPMAYSVFEIVEPPPLVGDSDGDGDVDLADLAVFQSCFTGEDGGPRGLGCEACDSDNDEDVDLADLVEFEAALTGP